MGNRTVLATGHHAMDSPIPCSALAAGLDNSIGAVWKEAGVALHVRQKRTPEMSTETPANTSGDC
jgi:hypothetical protein